MRALQARLDGPWLGVGIDTVGFAPPKRYLDQPFWTEVFRYVDAGPGPTRRSGSRPANCERLVERTASDDRLARRCRSVRDRDHVLLEPAWVLNLARRPRPTRCCSSASVVRERSSSSGSGHRRDRTIGQAAAPFDVVHLAGGYDLEVDTSVQSPEDAARGHRACRRGRDSGMRGSRISGRPGRRRDQPRGPAAR